MNNKMVMVLLTCLFVMGSATLLTEATGTGHAAKNNDYMYLEGKATMEGSSNVKIEAFMRNQRSVACYCELSVRKYDNGSLVQTVASNNQKVSAAGSLKITPVTHSKNYDYKVSGKVHTGTSASTPDLSTLTFYINK